MEHAQIRGLLGQCVADLVAKPGNLPMTPRPYQFETLSSIAHWLLDPDGTRRSYVSHATGLGKTMLFASIAAAAHGMRVLIIVPTKVLLEQTARVVVRFTGGMLGHLSSLANIEDENGETVAVRGMDHSAVVLTTDASFNKLAARIKQRFDPHIIIRDECHWGYEPSAIAALAQFPEAVIIGFSATPDYLTNQAKVGYMPVTLENGRTLYGPVERFADTNFQTCLDRRSVKWGIENGWLAPLAWGRIEFEMSLKEVPVVDGPNGPDYDEGKLQQMMSRHWSVMCETVRRLYENQEYNLGHRQAYALCPSVDAAEELARAISSLGVPAACISGDTRDTERNIILEAYNHNEICFLSSVMVLREGWDAPNAEVCMMLRPTKSWVLYLQAMGRALRKLLENPSKVALVLDAHFQGREFSPLSVPALYGKPGDEIPMGGIILPGHGGGGTRGGCSIESPFLPKNATPRLVVVEEYTISRSGDGRADSNGILFADGEEWTTVRMMARRYSIHPQSITSRLLKYPCRKRIGLTRKGHEACFYALNDLTKTCSDMLQAMQCLPEAGPDSTYQNDDGLWMSLKKAQGVVGVGEPAMIARLTVSACRSLQVRMRGQIITMFLLSDLRSICSDLLDPDLVSLRSNGTGRVGDETWCTLKALTKIFKMTGNPVRELLVSGQCVTKKGKTRSGHLVDCYALSQAERLFQNLNRSELLHAGEDGMLQADGEEWAHLEALALRLGISRPTVQAKVTQGQCRSRKALGLKNRVYDYYSVSDAERVCAEFLDKSLPRAGKDGTFMREDIEWATLNVLATRWSITNAAIKRRVRPDTCRMCRGIERMGRIVMFYAVEDVQRAVRELLDRCKPAAELNDQPPTP